jgi:hypothetical protein
VRWIFSAGRRISQSWESISTPMKICLCAGYMVLPGP